MLAAAAPGTRVAGRFLLEAIAGVGGMGTVYRAHDEQTGRKVALKLIQMTGKPHEVERFGREADLLAKLSHPGIVGYLSHGVTDTGEPYLAMEWLDGEDLAKRLDRGPLSLTESITLLRCVADALAHAHELGVVHRDLKPSNLFLRAGLMERVAILDFGIARFMATSQVMTRSGMLIGTPAYMAPEQARAERDVTPAADVFSLGCVLFECLTGSPPFAAAQMLAVLAKILFDEPPRLRRTRPEMPEAVDALLGRMLARERADRLPDARAILEALHALDDLSLTTELRPEESTRRARLGGDEQHLISVLVATLPSGALMAPTSPDATLDDPQLSALRRELSDQGARLELLAEGSLVAVLAPGRGAATDQAAQAARCALLLKARWPAATIALCTGRGLLQERLPVGEVLDRAAALLRDHPPIPSPSAQILLDDVTRGLLEVRFQVHRTLAGGYALSGETLDLDASRPLLGKPTPCVGRDVELGMLEAALAGCIEDAVPRAVLVTAPPGTGKSRLRHEFLRRVEARDEEILILLGRGEPMSAGSSYSLLGQALRRLCGIQDGESLPVRRQKLAARIGERLAAAEQERVVAFIGELCGAPLPDAENVKLRAARQDPQLMSDQISQALLDFLRAECAARPVLLVLEDLHWGDALTIKLCEAALRKLRDCPLMMLALARPELNELLPRLWSGAAQGVPLRPLSKKAGERLVQQVLGKQVAKETVARIVEQSEGNALFLEELIRAAADGRGDEAPETVLAMLQARIGRLPAGARRVLRAASVFGATCWLGGIRALLGGSYAGQTIEGLLSRLIEDEILEERRESRFPEELEYRFRHVLMRDAVYGLLTAEDRVLSHRGAGEYLEARGEQDALVLAEHFWQGQEADRAIAYYLKAAEESYEAFDMDATFSSAERGLTCGAAGEPRGALLSLQLAAYLGREQYNVVVAQGLDVLALLPSGSKRWCRAITYLFSGLTMTRQIDLLVELSQRFARVEPSADARGEYVRAAESLNTGLALVGEKEASRVFLRRARDVGAGLEHSDVVAWAHLKVAEANDHYWIEEASWSCMLRCAEGRSALRSAGEQRYQIFVSTAHGMALLELGDPAGAEADMRETLAQAERLNEPFPLGFIKVVLAGLLAGAAPQSRLDEPSRLARDITGAKTGLLMGMAREALAEIKRRQGDLAGADEEACAACELLRPTLCPAWRVIALRSRILLEQGRTEEALAIAEEGVQELERRDLAGRGEIALRLSLLEALAAAGRAEAARAALEKTLAQVRRRLADIPEAAARERYLTQVPTIARLRALAQQWLGLDMRAWVAA